MINFMRNAIVETRLIASLYYDEYESEMFDTEAKVKRHAEVFPEDCKRAFELGVRMASGK
jgi:hypothetical protein